MQLTLLRPANRKPREAVTVLTKPTLAAVQELLPADNGLWGCDIETCGVDAADPACFIVGIGLSNDRGSLYINLLEADDKTRAYIKDWLKGVRLTAFNTLFDGTFLQAWTGQWLNWEFDSYAYFKNLSSEGHPGQTWGLETAQRAVLGWDTSNKTVLDEHLKAAGLSKGDMWRLPAEILGVYCAADADAAWQLYHELNAQYDNPAQTDYHRRVFLNEVRLLAAQQLRGIKVDQEKLYACHRELIANIDSAMTSFLTHPDVAHHIEAYDRKVRDAWKASEPPALTAKGEPSARWQAWRDREQRHMADKGFNPNSKQQLGWLFYEALGNRPLKFTETGRPVVDRKVLPALGEPGKLLAEYNLLVKRRGYVERVMERSARDGCIHPQFNSVGTVTTRLGGSGGLNLQQLPKDPAFLSALAARPGYKLVQADAEALEPTILAEFSQDPTLLSVYGKDAKPGQDIYLLVAARIPALGREILRYYDPDNPTPESVAAAKKHCKRDRSIAKTVQLASSYGAGAAKIHETLALSGIDISLAQVRQIHTEYWRLFAGVKRFGERLQDMWMSNGGWIPSALGTPIPVSEVYLKDITNRFCQLSGHTILQLWIYHTSQALDEHGIPWHPWLIDQHDEMLIEVPEEWAPAAADAISEGLRRTNEELGMDIPIKGPPQIADNFAQIKCENYEQWLEQQDSEDDDDDAA